MGSCLLPFAFASRHGGFPCLDALAGAPHAAPPHHPPQPNTLQARELSVEADMAPVVAFLTSKGLRTPDVVAVVAGHPPVLSYSVDGRLAPFFEFMEDTVGVEVRA